MSNIAFQMRYMYGELDFNELHFQQLNIYQMHIIYYSGIIKCSRQVFLKFEINCKQHFNKETADQNTSYYELHIQRGARRMMWREMISCFVTRKVVKIINAFFLHPNWIFHSCRNEVVLETAAKASWPSLAINGLTRGQSRSQTFGRKFYSKLRCCSQNTERQN